MRMIKALSYYVRSLFAMVAHFENWPRLAPMFFPGYSGGTRTVSFRRKPMRIIVRSAMDVWSVKETFIDQFYTRYGVPIQNDWMVIDIGAGIGDYCLYATYAVPDVKLYAFEPFPESCALLRRNLALNGVDNVQVFQTALWGSSGRLDLDLSTGEPLQFSSQVQTSVNAADDKLTVEGLSLADVFRINALDHIDLLKMDCEGAEYEILCSTPPEILQRIARIIMEYHDLDKDHTHLFLEGLLSEQGYQVRRYPNFVHKDLGYLFAWR